MSEARKQALDLLRSTLSPEQVAAIAMIVETAEVQGDYCWNGEDSVYEDDVASTLNQLGDEFRGLIPERLH